MDSGDLVTVRPQRLLEQRVFAPGTLTGAPAGQTPLVSPGGGAAGDVLSFADAARALNDQDAFTLTLQTFNGHFVCAEQGGGDVVDATRTAAAGWETFTLASADTGNVRSGALVTLRASNGSYLSARGGAVRADQAWPGTTERFTLEVCAGDLLKGATVHLRACDGRYLCAESGGGGALVADRAVAREWETFSVTLTPVPPPASAPRAPLRPRDRIKAFFEKVGEDLRHVDSIQVSTLKGAVKLAIHVGKEVVEHVVCALEDVYGVLTALLQRAGRAIADVAERVADRVISLSDFTNTARVVRHLLAEGADALVSAVGGISPLVRGFVTDIGGKLEGMALPASLAGKTVRDLLHLPAAARAGAVAAPHPGAGHLAKHFA